MSLNRIRVAPVIGGLWFVIFCLLLNACSSGDDNGPAAPYCSNATQGASASLVTTSSNNQIPVYIADSSTTGSVGYPNEPLVSITICNPNHTSSSQCQTISNILVDTGSFGLRLFTQTLASNVTLTQETVTILGQTEMVGECAEFGTGSDWGAVQLADLKLGNQTATNIPIQVIDYNFSQIPSVCASLGPNTNPCSDQADFNGILGVGVFPRDCGTDCNSTDPATNYGQYFACDSTNGCFNAYNSGYTAVAIPPTSQVENPIAALTSGFNNGISLTLPSIDAGGASAVSYPSSFMTIGIGTTASNPPGSGVVVYYADPNGQTDSQGSDFLTEFNSGGGTIYGIAGNQNPSYLDSGSNALFIPTDSSLPDCSDGSGFLCPTGLVAQTATIESYNNSGVGTPSIPITFYVQNADSLFNTNFSAFNDIAGDIGNPAGFDWGLPFFYGRTIFVGIAGTTATYNAGITNGGPYWAF